jgi:hypothetical protein
MNCSVGTFVIIVFVQVGVIILCDVEMGGVAM